MSDGKPEASTQSQASDGPPPQRHAVAEAPDVPADPLGRGSFLERLGRFYAKDWAGTLPASPAAARRGVDAPLDSPPFPNADWGYNASPTIGAPDGNVYPLMTALGWQNARTKLYGWIDPSVNGSTSATNNYPLAYAVYPIGVELSQAVVYLGGYPTPCRTSISMLATTLPLFMEWTTGSPRPKAT